MVATPILGITEVAPNQNNKETTINDGFLKLESSLNATLAVSLASGPATLVINDFQSNWTFKCSGQTTTSALVIPNSVRMFAVWNTGSYAVTVETSSPSSTVVVGAGALCMMACDGSNNVKLIANSAVAAATNLFTGLTDAPGSYSGAALKNVRVNSGASALEFHTPALADLSSFGTPTTNYYPKWNGSGLTWSAAGGGPGATTFTTLTDVPTSYSGKANAVLQVNPAANGVQFTALTSLLSFVDLTDSAGAYAGKCGQAVVVNLTENGLTYETLPSLGTILSLTTGDANAGFEAGNLVGWTTTIGSSSYNSAVTAAGSVSPYSGTYFFQTSGAVTQTQLSHLINLTLLATNLQLDNDCRIDLPYAFVPLSATTTGLVTIQALDGAGALIASLNTGTISGTLNTWQHTTFSCDIPPGTRKIQIDVQSNDPTAVFAGWDLLDPVIRAIQNFSLENLTDVTVTSAAAGQPLVWNGAAWLNTSKVDLPAGSLITSTGTVALDRNNGEVQRLSLTGNTTLTVANWPAANQMGRLVLEVQNTGAFNITWPTGTKWPGGAAPTVTSGSGKRDLFVLMTFDGGT